jgi:hypothetical protein
LMTEIKRTRKHGSTTETHQSQSQPDGTAADDPHGETQPGPSAKKQTPTRVNRSTPTKSTEVSNAQTKRTSLSDNFGEAGDPHGRGNLQVPEQTVDSDKSPDANATFVDNPPTDKKPSTEGAGDVKRKKDEAEAA